MAYRTVMRFSRPERLIIEVAEPGRSPVRHDIRIGGIGEDGALRFIETDEGAGRAQRRFRLDHIAGAIRAEGTRADIRAVIVALHGATIPPTRNRPLVRANSFRQRLRNLAIGVGLGLACLVLGYGLYRATGDTVCALDAAQIAMLAIVLPLLGFALWTMRGILGDIRTIFRRRPPPD